MLPRLRLVLTSPAPRGGPILRPVLLPGDAVTCIQLVKLRGEPLGVTSSRARLASACSTPCTSSGGPASSSLVGLRPLLLADLSLEVCEGSRERHRVPPPVPSILAIPPRVRLAPLP